MKFTTALSLALSLYALDAAARPVEQDWAGAVFESTGSGKAPAPDAGPFKRDTGSTDVLMKDPVLVIPEDHPVKHRELLPVPEGESDAIGGLHTDGIPVKRRSGEAAVKRDSEPETVAHPESGSGPHVDAGVAKRQSSSEDCSAPGFEGSQGFCG